MGRLPFYDGIMEYSRRGLALCECKKAVGRGHGHLEIPFMLIALGEISKRKFGKLLVAELAGIAVSLFVVGNSIVYVVERTIDDGHGYIGRKKLFLKPFIVLGPLYESEVQVKGPGIIAFVAYGLFSTVEGVKQFRLFVWEEPLARTESA